MQRQELKPQSPCRAHFPQLPVLLGLLCWRAPVMCHQLPWQAGAWLKPGKKITFHGGQGQNRAVPLLAEPGIAAAADLGVLCPGRLSRAGADCVPRGRAALPGCAHCSQQPSPLSQHGSLLRHNALLSSKRVFALLLRSPQRHFQAC